MTREGIVPCIPPGTVCPTRFELETVRLGYRAHYMALPLLLHRWRVDSGPYGSSLKHTFATTSE